MQQNTQKGGAVKKWLLVAILGSVTALGVGTALAQVTGTTPDFATLLQQFGSLFGTGTGTTTQPTTPTTPPTTTQPGGGSGARQPLATDQFNMTGRAALSARAPGVWIQNAQAVQSGETDFFTGGVDTSDGFIKTTIDTILLDILDTVSTVLTGLDVLTGTGLPDLGLTPGTGGLTTIPNSTTTGAGTSTPVQ